MRGPYHWVGLVVLILIFGLIITGIINQEIRSEETRESCAKTDLMVQRYKGGWTHVYDCSNKGEINE